MSKIKLNLIVIRSSELHKLANFYQRLGLEFEYHHHGTGAFHYSCNLDGVIFEIYPLRKNDLLDKTTRLGFQVADLTQLITDLEMQNVRITTPPTKTPFGITAVIEDLDGRRIELTQL